MDPLVAATGQAYTYVGGSPVNGTDPTGNCPQCIALAPVVCPLCVPVILVGGGLIIGGWLIWNLVQDLHHQQDQSQICSGTQTLPEQQIQTQVQSKSEYLPPGMSKTQRDKYRDAVHRYKDDFSLPPNYDVPHWILDDIARCS